MDLIVFENNKPFVIDEFREGRFDGWDHVSATDFARIPMVFSHHLARVGQAGLKTGTSLL